jgi:lysophospholipase L1-like esterase
LSKQTAKKPRRRSRLKTILLVIAALGVTEVAVRIVGPELRSYRRLTFMADSEHLLIEDPQLGWKLRPNARLTFQGVSVRTDHRGLRVAPTWRDRDDSQSMRILCLGDGATFGTGVEYAYTYAAFAERELNNQFEGKRIVVYNAGVPGYSSTQTRRLAEQLIPLLKPNMVVVCSGTNDAWPVERADSAEFVARETSFLQPLLDSSDLAAWIAEWWTDEKPTSLIKNSRSAQVRVEHAELYENLREIVKATKASPGVPVIMAPPSNPYVPPSQPAFAFPDTFRWQDLRQQVTEQLKTEGKDAALAVIEDALEDAPESPYLLWSKGMLMSEEFDEAAGHALLERSFDLQKFTYRASLKTRAVIINSAEALNTSFADLAQVYQEQGPALEVVNLYQDWCHPAPKGQALIAAEVYRVFAGIIQAQRLNDKK